ncbi:hypothetical protein C7972_1263 [Arenibacter sp. ARW7G5Y1]|nr:hypothetical protein C7972_1263 [Arenibacter sp. ARW7G5Y1]
MKWNSGCRLKFCASIVMKPFVISDVFRSWYDDEGEGL